MNTQTEEMMAGLAASMDCPESIIQMLAEQEEDTEMFKRYLSLLIARVANYPRRHNRLAIATDKQGLSYYVITNYDYATYKWAIGLELKSSDIKITANKIYLRASGLPLKIIKVLEGKLENERED